MFSATSHQRLFTALQRHIVDATEITQIDVLTGGAVKLTLRLMVVIDGVFTPFALRINRHLSDESAELESLDLFSEATLLRAAKAVGVPVPEVIAQFQLELDELNGQCDAVLMQWLDGETLGQRIVHKDAFAQARQTLAYECGKALARIHAIDTAELVKQRLLPQWSTENLVEQTYTDFLALNELHATIELAYQWLIENLPDETNMALVHGDFRNGNLMVSEQGLHAVLDWELASIGDPMRDLGWLCVNSWRFGKPELPVGGFGEIEDLIRGYESESQVTVALSDIHYWQVFGSFWWAITTLRMAAHWRNQGYKSLEWGVVGRRTSEAQIDILNLISNATIDEAYAQIQTSRKSYGVRAEELLVAVGEYIQRNNNPLQQDRKALFEQRVALNALEIVQREIKQNSVPQDNEYELLCKLLPSVSSKDEDLLQERLVEFIRDKTISVDNEQLHQYLLMKVVRQVEIDQPEYSGLRTAREH